MLRVTADPCRTMRSEQAKASEPEMIIGVRCASLDVHTMFNTQDECKVLSVSSSSGSSEIQKQIIQGGWEALLILARLGLARKYAVEIGEVSRGKAYASRLARTGTHRHAVSRRFLNARIIRYTVHIPFLIHPPHFSFTSSSSNTAKLNANLSSPLSKWITRACQFLDSQYEPSPMTVHWKRLVNFALPTLPRVPHIHLVSSFTLWIPLQPLRQPNHDMDLQIVRTQGNAREEGADVGDSRRSRGFGVGVMKGKEGSEVEEGKKGETREQGRGNERGAAGCCSSGIAPASGICIYFWTTFHLCISISDDNDNDNSSESSSSSSGFRFDSCSVPGSSFNLGLQALEIPSHPHVHFPFPLLYSRNTSSITLVWRSRFRTFHHDHDQDTCSCGLTYSPAPPVNVPAPVPYTSTRNVPHLRNIFTVICVVFAVDFEWVWWGWRFGSHFLLMYQLLCRLQRQPPQQVPIGPLTSNSTPNPFPQRRRHQKPRTPTHPRLGMVKSTRLSPSPSQNSGISLGIVSGVALGGTKGGRGRTLILPLLASLLIPIGTPFPIHLPRPHLYSLSLPDESSSSSLLSSEEAQIPKAVWAEAEAVLTAQALKQFDRAEKADVVFLPGLWLSIAWIPQHREYSFNRCYV
ncbi:hypothetical protein C8R42DRAFT_646189 [Lentinula raphanica]|nr:hypothetical protein C8R42DRAFT_646189 [Lentinula raphanica]